MKSITLFLLGFCFIMINISKGQVSSMINQAPLLYNPSFAGSTANGRISAFGRIESINYSEIKPNHSPTPSFRNTNYLSFDNLDKTTGLSYGGFAYLTNSNLPKNNSLTIQGTLGPKYILKDKNDKPKFTFSPNVFIGYTFSNGSINQYKKTYPNGLMFRGDSYTYSYGYIFSGAITEITDKLETGISLLLNNEKGFVGVSYSNNLVSIPLIETIYNYTNTSDTIYLYRIGISDPGTLPGIYYKGVDSTISKSTVYANYFSLGFQLGRTIKFKKDSKFSITPALAFNLGIPYDNHLLWKINQANLNLTLTFDKYFLGGGFNNSGPCLYAGFQHSKFRSGVSFYYEKYNTSFWTTKSLKVELNLSYYLK